MLCDGDVHAHVCFSGSSSFYSVNSLDCREGLMKKDSLYVCRCQGQRDNVFLTLIIKKMFFLPPDHESTVHQKFFSILVQESMLFWFLSWSVPLWVDRVMRDGTLRESPPQDHPTISDTHRKFFFSILLLEMKGRVKSKISGHLVLPMKNAGKDKSKASILTLKIRYIRVCSVFSRFLKENSSSWLPIKHCILNPMEMGWACKFVPVSTTYFIFIEITCFEQIASYPIQHLSDYLFLFYVWKLLFDIKTRCLNWKMLVHSLLVGYLLVTKRHQLDFTLEFFAEMHFLVETPHLYLSSSSEENFLYEFWSRILRGDAGRYGISCFFLRILFLLLDETWKGSVEFFIVSLDISTHLEAFWHLQNLFEELGKKPIFLECTMTVVVQWA